MSKQTPLKGLYSPSFEKDSCGFGLIANIDNNLYPKVGGRLRLAHEENHQLSITTSIIKYDGKIAVVSATSATNKGSFQGLGMASNERDQEIAPAILELAETRAIGR